MSLTHFDMRNQALLQKIADQLERCAVALEGLKNIGDIWVMDATTRNPALKKLIDQLYKERAP